MKRVLLFVLVLFSAFSLYAHSLYVQAVPYSYQNTSFKVPIKYGTQYGWGAKVAYRYNYKVDATVGADFSFLDFKHEGVNEPYLVLSALVKTGFMLPIIEKLNLDFDFGVGTDLRIFNSASRVNPVMGMYLGLSYELSEKIHLTTGGDLRIAWQSNADKDYDSVNTSVLVNIGVKVNF